MALTSEQQIALYELMALHANTADGKSWFRTYVEQNVSGGNYAPALLAAAQQMDSNIDATDIGSSLTDLQPASIRSALGTAIYSGTGPCLSKDNCQLVYSSICS